MTYAVEVRHLSKSIEGSPIMKELTTKGIDLETYYLGLLGGGGKNVESIGIIFSAIAMKKMILLDLSN